MSEGALTGTQGEGRRPESNTELRTIGFRLREIQRLLSMRVLQENVRLEAEGLAPVTEAVFFKEGTPGHAVSHHHVKSQAAQLGGLDLGADVRVALLGGAVISGTTGPIDYVPTESLRLELRPRDDSSMRYEIRAVVEETGWSPVTVRRYELGDDDWEVLGVVRSVETE
ncbi:hypothetical protein [Haladaptatus sp. DJG-WS-42]|uniref:hypothetical protein n=1 Tax=Haladaptatus sp. DJG-WS-42 TaxID=3120516 RepID=UPI0030D62072